MECSKVWPFRIYSNAIWIREYANVNQEMSRSYWDYDEFDIIWK